MSYYALISFKTIKEGELYAFLKKIKDTCKEKFDEIAEDNYIFMPSIDKDYLLKNDSEYAKEELDRAWMRNSIFSYRFFYIPEHNLLGVFGAPVKDIFDLTCYFQNSCDQDYDFEDWKGIPIFEQIAEKWKNSTDSDTKEYYHNRYGDFFDEEENGVDIDYYRRTFAYDEIWRMCEHFLYSEDDVVYISMFGGYEIAEQKGFVHKCRKAYDEWKKQFEKPKESEDAE